MLSGIRSNLLFKESMWLVMLLAVLALSGWFLFKPLFFATLLLFLFCWHFFRNPERNCPQADDSQTIVCPADGKIVDIAHHPDGGFNGYHYKISIFLSPLNVHVNWIPITGVIQSITYVPGAFKMAFLPKSSELNEHNDLVIINERSQKVLVRQIAGTVARRIVCWLKQGASVKAGQKFGMIKFSSRVDLFLPEQSAVLVGVGQKVYGGKTVIGKLV